MAARTGFWTEERLKRLETLMQNHTPSYCADQFKTTPKACEEAYRFILQSKKLKLETYQEGNITVTVYAAGYTEHSADFRRTAGRTY